MAEKPKRFTYEVDVNTSIEPGQYIASIRRKDMQVGTVHLILAARRVQHKAVTDFQTWVLQVTPAPDARHGAVYDEESNSLWVRGEVAHPFFWFSRSEK